MTLKKLLDIYNISNHHLSRLGNETLSIVELILLLSMSASLVYYYLYLLAYVSKE